MILCWVERHARIFGMLGPGMVAAGTAVSLYGYHLGGGDSHPFYYWPVSGLGDHNVAPWPMVFNTCIIAGALLMALFMLGVGLQLNKANTWPGVAVGIVAALGFAGVGVFPSAPETLRVHFIWAGIAFVAATLLGAVFVAHLLIHSPPHFPRWLVFPSLFSVLATMGLITAIATLVSGHHVQVLKFTVGGVTLSGIIVMEWLAFVSLNVWILLTAWGMRRPCRD